MADVDLAAIRRALRDNPDLRPEHLFAGMPLVFRADRAPGLRATYRFEIEGPGGGTWMVRIADGRCETAPEAPDSFDVLIGCDARTFLDMAVGVCRPGEAFVDGRLRVGGDLALAMRFSRLFGGKA